MQNERHALKMSILLRAIGKEALDEIIKSYDQVKYKRGRSIYQPSELELSLFDKHLKGELSIKDVAKELAVTLPTVYARFSAIAISRLQQK